MFEKEAEEFERRKHYHYEDNDYCGDIADGIIQAYRAGAEFGYNKAMNEVKGIIKDLLHCLPKENIEGVYEVTEAAEQFISGMENGGMMQE